MTDAERRSAIALPIILLIAILLTLGGSSTGHTLSGFPLFAIGIIIAFVIQWIVYIPSFLNKTEQFFDLTGSITYISVLLITLLLVPDADARSVLLVVLIGIWAGRLGSFLFMRVRSAGHDGRFDQIKVSAIRFLMTWTLQGLWVSFSLAAALAAITSTNKAPIDAFAIIGLFVWVVGFAIEAISDRQKTIFRRDSANAGRFIRSGLWAWSRHPNYFGEIMLWIGIAVIAIPTLRGWQWVTMISPIFVIFLLMRISGVPMLEARADKKWGGQADYEQYKANTPVLIPRPPSRS